VAEFSISDIYTKFAVHTWKNVCVHERTDTFVSARCETVRTYCSDMKKIYL